jgi:hypothetical protein
MPRSHNALDVQFTGVVVVVDDEYQRLRRNVSRATTVHGGWTIPPCVQTTQRFCARLLGSDARPR